MLNAEFGFTLDAAADAQNHKCPRYYTREQDGLKQPWPGAVWCNPPYGRQIGKWLYGWHISDLKIYDKPRELREFKKSNRDCFYADLGLAKRDCPDCKNSGCFLERPPQSWCYVEGD